MTLAQLQSFVLIARLGSVKAAEAELELGCRGDRRRRRLRALTMHSVANSESASGTVSLDDAVDKTVGDVMIASPKTWPGDAPVSEVRRAFERASVRTVLLADGDRFVGAIERDGLPDDAPEGDLAVAYIEPRPLTATPGMPIPEAIKLLEGSGEPRLVVLDEGGVRLRGLLCLNNTATGFCIR